MYRFFFSESTTYCADSTREAWNDLIDYWRQKECGNVDKIERPVENGVSSSIYSSANTTQFQMGEINGML